MLSLTNVEHYANASQIDTYVAERDVVLTYVLKILDDARLIDKLAFKGGTCLKKVYYGKTTRFSEDLDFTSLDPDGSERLKKSLKQLFDSKKYYDITFEIKDDHTTTQGTVVSYGAVIQYTHDWQSAQFDFEVSYREKPALVVESLPLQDEIYFKYIEFDRFKVPSLHREELMAEKIRAAFQRLRPRDVYDLHKYSQSAYNRDLVRSLAVIKCWNVHDPFNPELLLQRIKGEKYKWDDLKRLVRPNQMVNEKKLVSETVKSYSYLTDVNSDLKQIIDDSKKHKLAAKVDKVLKSITAKAA